MDMAIVTKRLETGHMVQMRNGVRLLLHRNFTFQPWPLALNILIFLKVDARTMDLLCHI
jgi:hypothetical protein